MRVVRHVRRVPRRLHGGEVLHRAAARTGPTPSACSGTARRRCAASGRSRRVDHSRVAVTRRRVTSRRSDGVVRVGRRGRSGGRSDPAARPSTRRSWPAPSAGRRCRDNVAAFAELGFAPHVAGASGGARPGDDGDGRGDRPAGAALARPACRPCTRRASVAVARAAAARGTAMGLSGARVAPPIEDVVAAEPEDVRAALLGGLAGGDRGAGGAGAGGGRGRADPHARLDVHARARLGQPDDPGAARPARRWRGFAPEVLRRPRWALARWARAGHPPALEVPNVDGAPGFFAAYGEWMGTPPPTWEDLALAARRCGTGRSCSRA